MLENRTNAGSKLLERLVGVGSLKPMQIPVPSSLSVAVADGIMGPHLFHWGVG